MQLSEQQIIEIGMRHFREGHSPTAIPNFVAAVQDCFAEALRAQADAQPVAWRVGSVIWPQEDNAKIFSRDTKQGIEPLYTHPEASAPGLSEDAKDLLSAMGFRLMDDFYLRGEVPDDSEESWEVVHRDTVAELSAGAAHLDDDAVYTVLRNYDADMTRKTAEAIAHDLRLTRASAATVAEPRKYPLAQGYQSYGDGGDCEQAEPVPYDGLTEQFSDEVSRLANDAPGIREAVAVALGHCGAIIAPAEQQAKPGAGEPPLGGRWHHGNGVVVCGTLRIFGEDFDTDPAQDFKESILTWVCDTLNAAQDAYRAAQSGQRAGVLEKQAWRDVLAEPSDQFERLDLQNHQLRRAMQKIMARLTELLDEDKFAEMEAITMGAGVDPPQEAPTQQQEGDQ